MIEITSANELFDLTYTEDSLVVDFAKRNGCVPCRRLAPHFEAADRSIDGVTFAVVYLDELPQEDFFVLVDEFKLMQTPTVLLFKGNAVAALNERTAPLLIKEINSLTREDSNEQG